MNKSIRTIVALLLVMIMMLGVGCSKKTNDDGTTINNDKKTSSQEGTGKKGKIKIYVMYEDINRIKLFDNYYSKRLPELFSDYTIEFEHPSGMSYPEKLKIYLNSGELPDIFWGIRDTLIDAEPLDNYISDNFYTNKGALLPHTDGKVYALSAGTDSYFTSGLFYNKAMFEENSIPIPTDYESLKSAVQQFKELDMVPIATTSWAICNFMLQDFVCDIYDTDAKAILESIYSGKEPMNHEAMKASAGRIQELYEIGAFPPDISSASFSHDNMYSLLNTKKSPMFFGPLWEANTDQVTIDLDYMSLVSYNQEPRYITAWGQPSGGFMIAKDSKHKDIAFKIAEEMVKSDAEYFSKEVGSIVALSGDEFKIDENSMNKLVRPIYKAISDVNTDKIVNVMSNALSTPMSIEYLNNMNALLAGALSADEFINILHEGHTEQ